MVSMEGIDDRCIHEMLLGTCAICLRQELGDEEEPLIFKGIISKYEDKND